MWNTTLAALWLVPCALLSPEPLSAQEESTGPQPTAGKPSADGPEAEELPALIDVTRVAPAAQTTLSTFQRIEKTLVAGSSELESVTSRLETWQRTIPPAATVAQALLESTGSITNVEETRKAWVDDQREISPKAEDLSEYVKSLHADLGGLQRIRLTWQRSLDSFQGTAPEAVVNRAGEIIQAAEELASKVRTARDNAIAVQNSLAEILQAIQGVLDEAVEARLRLQSQLFTIDVEPLWTALADQGLPLEFEPIQREWTRRIHELERYVAKNRARFYLHGALSVAVLIVIVSMWRVALSWTQAERDDRSATLLLRRPFATAIGISLLLNGLIHIHSVIAFRMVLVPLVVAVVLRLAGLVLRGVTRSGLVTASVFYGFDYVRGLLWNEPATERVVLLIEAIAGIVCLIILHSLRSKRNGSPRMHGILRIMLLVLLVFGAFCLVVGFFGLGRLITYATVRLPFTGYAFLSVYFVLCSTISVALHTPLLRRLRMVSTHSAVIRRQLTRTVALLVGVLFTGKVLELYSIQEPLLDVLRRILVTPLEIGSLSVSLGQVLSFVVVVWLSFLISRVVRFLFREEVFARTQVPHGTRYAASAALHYTVLSVGILAAILAAGVDMGRFALLGGAVGIGIGFGLQNVVNNFVSGLILLFERPIQIRDRVEVDGIAGEVLRIGIRSSTVRTFDGAEVIVPNSDLIANKLTNWTLTDRQRRLIIPIGVKYGTDPERVLELLLRVARENNDVLEHPPPMALFRCHGDSSLNFELRVWTERSNEWLRVESDLTVAVNRILTVEGIEIPFPQRDLHLRSSDVPIGRSGAADDSEAHTNTEERVDKDDPNGS